MARAASFRKTGSFRKAAVDEAKRLTPIDKLAKKLKFSEIATILTHEDNETVKAWLYQGDSDNSASSDCASADFTMDASVDDCAAPVLTDRASRHSEHTTALHLIMKYRPPVALVDLLCQKLHELKEIPIPEDFVDNNGMSPLHIAVARGCDIEVVRRLLQGEAGDLPATTMDARGRLPLHWACTYARRRGFFSSKKSADNAVKNAYMLVRAYPHAKIIKDEMNETPLDLARKNKADERIIAALHPTRRQLKSALSGIFTCSVTSGYGGCGIDIPHAVGSDDKDSEDVSSVGLYSHRGARGGNIFDDDDFYTLKSRPVMIYESELEERLAKLAA